MDGVTARAIIKLIVTARWDEEMAAGVMESAADCASRFGSHAVGVLYYGSCLRTGVLEDRILDFYVLVDDYKAAYGHKLGGYANRILPPNVYYKETETPAGRMRAKYAVLSLEDFERRCSGKLLNVSVWARFCQPCVLLSATDTVRDRVVTAIEGAVATMLRAAAISAGPNADAARLWSSGFSLTYGAELRSEGPEKGREIYELDAAYYNTLTRPGLVIAQVPVTGEGAETCSRFTPTEFEVNKDNRSWRARRWNGKLVSFLRLVKAAITFDGGIDYLAWKISRHSGVPITIKPWHRRFPLIAGLVVFIPVKLKGGFR